MSGQHGQSASKTKTSPKQGPLRATMPISSVTKEGSGLRHSPNSSSPNSYWQTTNFDNTLGRRSPGAAPSIKGVSSKSSNRDCTIRRTASLDAVYLRGLFPRESVFWHRDRATQTDRSSSLDSLQNLVSSDIVEDRLARLTIRQRRRDSNNDKGDQFPSYQIRNPSSPVAKNSGNIPPKSSRSSEEGLNQEIELYAINLAESQCDRLKEPIPEGRKAPVAELIRDSPYLRTHHQLGNQNSSANFNCYVEDSPMRDSISPIPGRLDTPHSETEDSQGSSPDQDRMLSGSSPQINRFSSRAPPDGCERVLSKSVPILRPIPREVVSHPNTLFTLKPSSHSAFESLRGGIQISSMNKEPTEQKKDFDDEDDGDSPKVPDQEDP